MNLVIIAPSGAVRSALERLPLRDADQVTVISAASPDVESTAVRALVFPAPLGRIGSALERVLAASVIGRNLQRLTPLDGGRRMARVALRSTAVRDAVAQADLVAVLERDGILTGWRARRRWAREETPAVFGAAPAETILKGMRAGA
ncbi:hypothetical protein ACOKGD_10910 [Microbacterium phosphatis]|uniref:hypothetical protein n=1 Tax=Microbacterium phosphatis TaxID=3140248 RepID=UPI0031407664